MHKVVVGIISRINETGEMEWLLASSATDFGKYTGFYYPPGGHIEDDETEEEALAREIKEELNLDANPLARIATTRGDVPNQETYWWTCEATGEIQIDPELRDAQYFTQKQIQSEINVWPATKAVFNDYVFDKSA